MKRSFALVAATGLFLVACQATPQTTQDTTPIRLGYLGPLTGDAASYGTDTLNALKIKVDEVNAKGGINGRMVEIVPEDGRCNGGDATNAVQKLVAVDKVQVIINGGCSSEVLAAASITEPNKVILISGTASSPDIATAGDFVFRTMPSDAYKGIAIGNYLNKAGLKRVAIISENTDYAIGIHDAVVKAVGADAVVFDEKVDQGVKDFRTLVTRLKGLQFDVFIPNMQSDATMSSLMQQLRDQGIRQPAVSQDVADSVTLGKLATEAVEGMKMINTSNKLGDTGSGSFAAQFRAKYGEPQSNMSFATLTYDAAGAVLEAIGKGANDSTAIRDYLYSTPNFQGAAGDFHFDKNGEIVGIGYALKQFKDGKIEELEVVPLQ